jgi:hypothetical protein
MNEPVRVWCYDCQRPFLREHVCPIAMLREIRETLGVICEKLAIPQTPRDTIE